MIPTTDYSEVKSAVKNAVKNLKKGTKKFTRTISFRGGSKEGEVYWNNEKNFWFYLSEGIKNRYWFCFGTQDPNDANQLNITIEINPPKEGYNRRIAGCILKDERGSYYLAHSGKIGGGRKGIGKDAFLNFYKGDWVENIIWPDNVETQMLVIGEIENEDLSAQLKDLIDTVEEFKKNVTTTEKISQGKKNKAKKHTRLSPIKQTFQPEFEGVRKGYRLTKKIISRCSHGTIVNNLKKKLENQNLLIGNDRNRDLYIIGNEGLIDTLYEVKTCVDSNTIYTAIGQLLFNAAFQEHAPKLFIVLPANPTIETKKILKKLKIETVRYDHENGKSKFYF